MLDSFQSASVRLGGRHLSLACRVKHFLQGMGYPQPSSLIEAREPGAPRPKRCLYDVINTSHCKASLQCNVLLVCCVTAVSKSPISNQHLIPERSHVSGRNSVPLRHDSTRLCFRSSHSKQDVKLASQHSSAVVVDTTDKNRIRTFVLFAAAAFDNSFVIGSSGRVGILLLEHFQETWLNRVFHDKANNFDVALLAQAMNSSNCLRFQGRIEGRLHQKDSIRLSKIDSNSTGPV